MIRVNKPIGDRKISAYPAVILILNYCVNNDDIPTPR